MFIEFDLSKLRNIGFDLHLIRHDIAVWANRYGIPYTQKTIKRTHRLAFDQDRFYTVFATTWNSEFDYRLIDRRW